MTDPITDAEIDALISTDNKLQLRSLETSLSSNSLSGGSQRVALSGGIAQAVARTCKFCRIQCASTNTEVVRVRIGSVCGANDGVELSGNPVLTPYSLENLNVLYFYSADIDAIVDIEYFD